MSEAPIYVIFVPLIHLSPLLPALQKSLSFLVLEQGLANFLETRRKVIIFRLRCTTGCVKIEYM